jgi:hypothetical protein
MDYLSLGVSWSGRLQEADFLARIYDLDKMPSNDHRFDDASADIWQHRTNNNDWPDDWVFTDNRFNLLKSPDAEFLTFLCETVHPVVRPDEEKALIMVSNFNIHLRQDGWELFEKSKVSGRSIYGFHKVGGTVIFEEPTGWEKVDRQIGEARSRLKLAENEEQFQAIGLLLREALISLAQATYNPKRHPIIDGINPSETDAGRMLEAFFEAELKGGVNEEARAHAKAALRLANALVHRRTATFKEAALCAEASVAVVNLVAIICGKRDQL